MMKTALLAGLMTLGIVIAGPAIASGEPKAWDKDKYDQCLLDEVDQGQLDPEDIAAYCCAISGGDWDQEVGQCVRPSRRGADHIAAADTHAGHGGAHSGPSGLGPRPPIGWPHDRCHPRRQRHDH